MSKPPPSKLRGEMLRTLAARTASRVGNPPGLFPLLLRSLLPWVEPTVPAPFGFSISADGRDIARVRTAFTPAADCEPAELHTLLGAFGDVGIQAADLVETLGPGTGFERGGIEIGFGFDARHLRAYCFCPGEDAVGARVPGGYAELGWCPRHWAPSVDNALQHIPSRVVGYARRFGGPTTYVLYLVATSSLAKTEIYRQNPDMKDFAARCGGPSVFRPGNHGWQLGIDDAGELIETKLYLIDPPDAFRESACSAPDLAPFFAWCDETAAAAQTTFLVSCAALRLSAVGSSASAYVNFLWSRGT